MNNRPSPRLCATAVRRIRRLAELEACLEQCRAAIARLDEDRAVARSLARRVAAAQDEIDRLRGLDPRLLDREAQEALHEELRRGRRAGGREEDDDAAPWPRRA